MLAFTLDLKGIASTLVYRVNHCRPTKNKGKTPSNIAQDDGAYHPPYAVSQPNLELEHAPVPSAKPWLNHPLTHTNHSLPPLSPPKDDPFTPEELSKFNGSDASKPVYVAIKGQIFDVSPKREMYSPGKGYHIFAGKDGSAGLGKSSLKPEDAISDYSGLDEKELKVLDDWVNYYTKVRSAPSDAHDDVHAENTPPPCFLCRDTTSWAN